MLLLLLRQTLRVLNPQVVAKNYSLYQCSKSNFADEECYMYMYIISAISKI